eukprot:COSAG03_NODE_3447_length_2005_cov_4.209125_2_plen_169_part_00
MDSAPRATTQTAAVHAVETPPACARESAASVSVGRYPRDLRPAGNDPNPGTLDSHSCSVHAWRFLAGGGRHAVSRVLVRWARRSRRRGVHTPVCIIHGTTAAAVRTHELGRGAGLSSILPAEGSLEAEGGEGPERRARGRPTRSSPAPPSPFPCPLPLPTSSNFDGVL